MQMTCLNYVINTVTVINVRVANVASYDDYILIVPI